jgi:hypothetical protein
MFKQLLKQAPLFEESETVQNRSTISKFSSPKLVKHTVKQVINRTLYKITRKMIRLKIGEVCFSQTNIKFKYFRLSKLFFYRIIVYFATT